MRTELRRRALTSVTFLIYPLAAAMAGIACRMDFVASMERLATHKARARIQITTIVCRSATKANSMASGK